MGPKDVGMSRTGKVANEAIGLEQGGNDHIEIEDGVMDSHPVLKRELFSHDEGPCTVIGAGENHEGSER